MATTHSIVNLPTANTAVVAVPKGGFGHDVTIQNISAGDIFLGGDGVTTTDYGFKLAAGSAISFELDGQDSISAVAATNDYNVAVLIINLEKSK